MKKEGRNVAHKGVGGGSRCVFFESEEKLVSDSIPFSGECEKFKREMETLKQAVAYVKECTSTKQFINPMVQSPF
jgi:hypothetical protein